jgi:hypothetical protein
VKETYHAVFPVVIVRSLRAELSYGHLTKSAQIAFPVEVGIESLFL